MTDGETNASLRKGDEVAAITLSAAPSCRRPAGRRPGTAHPQGSHDEVHG